MTEVETEEISTLRVVMEVSEGEAVIFLITRTYIMIIYK